MDDERDGILQVGEVPVIRRRDSATATDVTEARRSGRRAALQELSEWTLAQQRRVPAYEDPRPWHLMQLQIKSMIQADDHAAA